MSARTRAAARLDRRVPDPSRWDGRENRGLTERVLAREGAHPERILPIPSAGLHPASGAVREMRIRHPGRPAPNAPLLIRLVRTPFVHPTGKPVRITIPRPARTGSPARLGHVGPGRPFRALLREIGMGARPLRIDHRPVERPRPFPRARTAPSAPPTEEGP